MCFLQCKCTEAKIPVRGEITLQSVYRVHQMSQTSTRKLKVSMGLSDAVIRRKTDSAMVKKMRKKANNGKTYTENQRLNVAKNGDEHRCSGRVGSPCTTIYQYYCSVSEEQILTCIKVLDLKQKPNMFQLRPILVKTVYAFGK